VTEDAETSVAAKSLERMVFDRALGRLSGFINAKSSFPKDWQEAAQNMETILWVTPAELESVTVEVMAIFNRFIDRISDPSARTEGALPVEALMFAYPVRLPGTSL
jgi:hypothetical protein